MQHHYCTTFSDSVSETFCTLLHYPCKTLHDLHTAAELDIEGAKDYMANSSVF